MHDAQTSAVKRCLHLSYPDNKRTYIDKCLQVYKFIENVILHKQSPDMHLYFFSLKIINKLMCFKTESNTWTKEFKSV